MRTEKTNIVRRMIPGLILGFVVFLTLTFLGDLKAIGELVLIADMSGSASVSGTLLVRLAISWFGVGLGLVVWVSSCDLILFSPIIKKTGGYNVERV